MSASDLAAGYELAFSEARRALDDQERVASDLRSRAAVLIATAAVVTSFFGGRMGERGLTWSGWVAVGCFCLLGVAVLAILWPHHRWRITLASQRIVDRFVERREGPVPLGLIHRELAAQMNDSWAINARLLRILTTLLRLAAGLLVGEVLSWLVTVAATG